MAKKVVILETRSCVQFLILPRYSPVSKQRILARAEYDQMQKTFLSSYARLAPRVRHACMLTASRLELILLTALTPGTRAPIWLLAVVKSTFI